MTAGNDTGAVTSPSFGDDLAEVAGNVSCVLRYLAFAELDRTSSLGDEEKRGQFVILDECSKALAAAVQRGQGSDAGVRHES